MNCLPVCRVCLAYDTRLCSIMDGQLRNIYETLVESSLNMEDMLPTSACYICFSLMKKILQFRDKSQKANQILQQILISGMEPSVSSLDALVRGQSGISWTLGISNIEKTTTTIGEIEVEVKIESVKSEMDFDGMDDLNEDYSDSMPVYKDSTSDSEEDLPLQNISEQCKTDRVKIEKTPKVQSEKSSGQGAASPKKRKTVYTNKKPHKCNICNKGFPGNSSLINHLRVHTKEKPFKCDICGKGFSQSVHLTTHLRIHSGEKPHSCPNCNKRFSDRSSLTFHLTDHTNEKPFKCDVCGKCFARNGDLTRHKRIHSDEKPYSCSYCDKTFTDRSTLTQHLRVHTNERPYKCDICDKGFSVSGNLVKHLRVHLGDKQNKKKRDRSK